MDAEIYQKMIALEKEHWWFAAHRIVLDRVLSNIALPVDAQILEAGCGTGGNFAMLARHGQVFAMEADDIAYGYARRDARAEVEPGRLPDDIPFCGRNFDLIVLLDVLEHLADDLTSLRNLYLRLKPCGWLLITVPAHPFMWSHQDEILHHHRRYTKSGLLDVVKAAGYKVCYISYFNSLLFPLIFGMRLFQRLIGRSDLNELAMPPQRVNRLLTTIFASERHAIGCISVPFGVSLLLLAQKYSLDIDER